MKHVGPLCILGLACTQTFAQANELASARQCAKHIIDEERKRQIPKGLLFTISKIESGRKIKEHPDHLPWPWAINANGKGMFFKTKAEAIATVNKLLKQGMRNIDIGCMQINYNHHGERFQSISHMFDPRLNVEYGAKFLTDLRTEHGSWTKAVGLYHSATLKYQVPYKQKVYRMWVQERHKISSFLAPFYGTEDPPGMETTNIYDQGVPLYFMLKPTRVSLPSAEQISKNRLKHVYVSPAMVALRELRSRREKQQEQYEDTTPRTFTPLPVPVVQPTLFPAVTTDATTG